MIGICCLEPMNLRLLVGGAAVATYIYTPFLKRLLVVKNVIVAAIIASSILAGGLVAGQLPLRLASNTSHGFTVRSRLYFDGFGDLERTGWRSVQAIVDSRRRRL